MNIGYKAEDIKKDFTDLKKIEKIYEDLKRLGGRSIVYLSRYSMNDDTKYTLLNSLRDNGFKLEFKTNSYGTPYVKIRA